MSVLDRKLVREMRASKGLILAITSLVAVGVMCFVYMKAAHHNLRSAQERYYAQCRLADFWIDLKKVPVAELAELANMPGVSEIRPRIQHYATVDLDRVIAPLNGLVLSLPDRRQPTINDIVLKRGSYYTESRRNEVIVNEAFAQRHALYPGQWIHLILNNRRQELLIVGTAISAEFVYLVGPGAITPDPEHFGVFYLKQTYAEEVFDLDGAANQVVGTLAPQYREQPDELLRRAEARLEPYGVFNVTPRKYQYSNRFLSDEIRGLGTFSNILPVIFLTVAALVLNVLMVRLIDQQRSLIGTLKGLGYSDAQIFLHFVKFGGLIGLGGGLVGLALGNRMSVFVTDLYKQFFEFPDLHNEVTAWTYGTAGAIAMVCSLIGSMYGARTALRMNPAQAMRPRPPAQGGKIWLERLGFIWQRLSFGWRMVLRNVIRNRLRTGVGMFAAAMGASIMTTGFMMRAATHFIVDFQFQQIMQSDIDLTFKDERGDDALLEARKLPGVELAEPVLDVACEFLHGPYRKKGGVTGLIENARLTIPRDASGNALRPPPYGLLMTRKMAQKLRVSIGDQVTVVPSKGLRQSRQAVVADIADSYLGMSVYADIHYLSSLLGEELALSGVQLKVDRRPDIRDQLNREIKQLPAVQSVGARADMIDNLNNTLIKTQMIFIGLLTMFAGVIFFSSILNASLINLAERRREVATLVVQGYTQWQVGGYFLRESLVVTLCGAALGLPLGYLLTRMLAVVYDTDMFRLPLIVRPELFALPMVFAAVFTLAAHVIVQRLILQLDWRDALNVKE